MSLDNTVLSRLHTANLKGKNRFKKSGRRVDDVSDTDLLTILRDQQGYRCCYCPQRIISDFELDHKLPFHAGGHHILRNIQFTCDYCNISKLNRHRPYYFRDWTPRDIDHTKPLPQQDEQHSW